MPLEEFQGPSAALMYSVSPGNTLEPAISATSAASAVPG